MDLLFQIITNIEGPDLKNTLFNVSSFDIFTKRISIKYQLPVTLTVAERTEYGAATNQYPWL